MSDLLTRVSRGLNRRWRHARQNARLERMSRLIAEREKKLKKNNPQQPVIFFNASTRLGGLSLNAGFSLVTSWALRLQGVPVVYFACERGLSHCVLGTSRDNPAQPPPCQECIAQSRHNYAGGDVRWFNFRPDPALECLIEELPVAALEGFVYQGMPLGRLVLPSMRWILRRHHLEDDDSTRYLYRQYILSAWGVATSFQNLISSVKPQAIVLFNGMFYPEAAVRWVAQHQPQSVRVISHEVGLRPFSGFFTTGEATAYPIDLPDTFKLDNSQSVRLDAYLSQRFKGNFSMAGVRFWPEMEPMDPSFWEDASRFRQIVPVFTNVIFDTSQDHANVIFEDMFAWLLELTKIIEQHPDTLFVIRAHPDENRPGKRSLESVTDWVKDQGVDQMINVRFIPPEEYFSSYELIERSKFVCIYNSTIGLEATLLGAAVLSAGKARFTQIPTVFFPQSKDEYLSMLTSFLQRDKIDIPPEFQRNARRFLYAQVFQSSLLFDRFLEEDGVWKGYVALKQFIPEALYPENSESMRIILEGILSGGNFLAET